MKCLHCGDEYSLSQFLKIPQWSRDFCASGCARSYGMKFEENILDILSSNLPRERVMGLLDNLIVYFDKCDFAAEELKSRYEEML